MHKQELNNQEIKVGFVALVGKPNVGKSSLLNALINYDLAITSPMIQTTRDQIKGIYNDEMSQIIFVDTPGIHKPQHQLGKVLNKRAAIAIQDADLTLVLLGINDRLSEIEDIIKQINLQKSLLVLTKIDLTEDFDKIKTKALQIKALGFETVIATSIKIKESLNELIKVIQEKLPNGPMFYNPEDVSDVSLRFMAKEIIREAIIKSLFQELPHQIAVVIDEFDEPTNLKEQALIKATIFVERDSQKGIVIGQKGQMIKTIGSQARKNLTQLLERSVHLDLSVKVNKKWTKDEKKLKQLGY